MISIIADDRLKSAAMTGEWEAKLRKIEQNTYNPDQFMAEIIQFTQQLKDASAKPLYDNTQLGSCPLCSHPIIEGRQGYGCSQWRTGCQFVLWKQSYGLIVTRDMACQLLQTGRTVASYPVVLNDTRFNAQLTLTNRGELGYHALQNKPSLTIKTRWVIARCVRKNNRNQQSL